MILAYTVDRQDAPGAALSFRTLEQAEIIFSFQAPTGTDAMTVRLMTSRPQKARICRIRYPGSQHGLNAWELPPNIPGYQWIIHQRSHTVGRTGSVLVGERLKVSQQSMVLRDAAAQIISLLVAWCALQIWIPADKQYGYGLALGLLVIYAAAIQSKVLIVRVGGEDCWYYVETAVGEEGSRREDAQVASQNRV